MPKAYLFILLILLLAGSTVQKKRGLGKAKGVYPGHSYKCEIHNKRSFSLSFGYFNHLFFSTCISFICYILHVMCFFHFIRFLSLKIFFEMTGPPTCGRVLGMGTSVKPRDVYGPSSSSQCSKQCQGDCLKENEGFELRLKEIEDKRSAEKMEFKGTISQLKRKCLLLL